MSRLAWPSATALGHVRADEVETTSGGAVLGSAPTAFRAPMHGHALVSANLNGDVPVPQVAEEILDVPRVITQ